MAFEAYAVSVRVSLINGVSAGLIAMARQFKSSELAAAGLRKELKGIAGMMMVGGVMTGAGLGIFAALEKAAKPAEEYARALNRLHMAGLNQVEVAQAVGAAWKNTGTVMTTTATDNLSALLDLRNILGSMSYASRELPMITKIGAVLSSASEGKITPQGGQDIAFSMAKALDIIGAARNPATFEHEAEMMAKSITAFQGRVTPKMFQSVFQYARQAKFDMSDEFKYQFLPTLMLEMSQGSKSAGGGSRGVGPMIAALYRVTNQGYISKKALPILERLHLLTGGSIKTTTGGTITGPLKGSDLAAQNPFTWSQQVFIPAIGKTFGAAMIAKDRDGNYIHADQLRKIATDAFRGNQLAAAAITEFISKPTNFFRDQRILAGAMTYKDAYAVAMKNDPALSRQAMGAQWNNFLTSVGPQIVTDMVSIMRTAAPMLHDAAMAFQKNPGAAKAFIRSLETIATILTVGGALIMSAGVVRALGLFFKVFGLARFIPWAPLISGLRLFSGLAWGTMATGVGGITGALGALAIVRFALIGAGIVGVVVGLKMLGDYLSNKAHPPTDAANQKFFGETNYPGRSDFVRSQKPTLVIHHTSILDGKPIARSVTRHQVGAANGPSSGPAGFDYSRSYAPAGIG